MSFQKFKAIENDKRIDFHNSLKGKKANSFFTGGISMNELSNPDTIYKKALDSNSIAHIKLDLIKERVVNNFDNISNDTLKQSIRALGVLNPILVRSTDFGKYVIISGHRRFNAIKDLVADLRVEKAQLEKNGLDTKEINIALDKFSTIPAIVLFVVDDDSELLGTDAKYITKDIEEAIYLASNLETRQISERDIITNIKYFYDLINNDQKYRDKLLFERNKTATRKATKLNIADVISKIITDDLKFNISRTYVIKAIFVLENADKYPAYYKIVSKRLFAGEGINQIASDFKMAIAVHEGQFEDKDIKQEYHDRMEKTDEPMISIYNEFFDIRDYKQPKSNSKNNKSEAVAEKVRNLLIAIKDGKIAISEAIKNTEKYL